LFLQILEFYRPEALLYFYVAPLAFMLTYLKYET